MTRSVFVLGAGFSAPAQMPIQADVMREVVKRTSQPFQDTVRQTFTTLFSTSEPEDMAGVPLEDVFTMLDRARKSGETIRGLSRAEMENSYEAMLKAITQEFNNRLRDFDEGENNYAKFFQELIKKRVGAGDTKARKADPFSILTLNWDTIPDYLIQKIGKPHKAAADYACYDYDVEGDKHHVPSLRLKSKGSFNVKLLKLHGSLNWLVCTCCGRLFSTMKGWTRPPVAFLHSRKCRFCKAVDLENLIVTPTLVKEISHTQLKNVWHNALIDLQETERIVFVGYSFPLADFEFRYVLLKAVTGNPDVKIRVVLYPPDHLCNDERMWERNLTQERYGNFFGNRDIDFKYMDANDFMADPNLIWHW